MREISCYLYSPGGNDTALVEFDAADKALKETINNNILSQYKSIEQVGFVYEKDGQYHLEMAGGEFCGNASRCAAYHFLKGRNGNIKLNVSPGIVIDAGVPEKGKANAQIPLLPEGITPAELEQNVYSVKLDGISFLIANNINISDFPDDRSFINKAKEYIDRYSSGSEPAFGVVFAEKLLGNTVIHPVIYVRAIDTLYYETACGSGSAATAALLTFLSGDRMPVKLFQPSGKIIKVTVDYNGDIISDIKISGEIKALTKCKIIIK